MATIERVPVAKLERLLGRVLAAPGWAGQAAPGQVHVFRMYLDACAERWIAWRTRRHTKETGLLLAMMLPGRTVVLIPADPGAHGIEHADQQLLLSSALSELHAEQFAYAQALVEPGARHKRALFEERLDSAGSRNCSTCNGQSSATNSTHHRQTTCSG